MKTEELILQTVSYFNLFDHPLMESEITALLSVAPDSCAKTLSGMVEARMLSMNDDYIFIPGRAYIVEKRLESEKLLRKNIRRIRMAGWLISHFPYVRGIILTGSAAKGVLGPYDDFDFFILAREGHLWICKTVINIFRLLVSMNYSNRLHKVFCCNTFLSENHLSISDRNRFTAIEIVFAKPVYNRELFERFMAGNRWAAEYYSVNHGTDGIPPVMRRLAPVQYAAEMLLDLVSALFFKGNLDRAIMKKYHSFWLRKQYVAGKKDISDRSNDHWIKAECGRKKEFLLRHFGDYHNGEFNCSLRTRIHLKQRSSSRIAPDILFTHSFFISMTRTEKKVMRPYVPLGPLYVAAYLREKGFSVDFYDPVFDRDPDEFARFVINSGVSIVGIHATELCRKNAVKMIHHAREAGAGVIMGGPDPSADPQYYMDNGADCVVVGEGEETMFELLTAIKTGDRDIYGIPGIYTERGMFAHRTPVHDLDSLPFPARDLVDLSTYFNKMREHHGYTSLMVSSSRGCPFSCAWCSRSVSGSDLRRRSAANLVGEIVELKKKYKADHLWITDDNFTLDTGWVESFHREVLERNAIIPFECFSRAVRLPEGVLQKMREAGCIRIWYGAESGSQRVLDRMKKGISVHDIPEVVERTRKNGIESGLHIMLAYPGESIGDIEATRKLLRISRPEQLIVKYSFPLIGTEFYDEVKRSLSRWRRMEPRDSNLWIPYRTEFSGIFYLLVKLLLLKEHRVLARKRAGWKSRILLCVYSLLYESYKFYYLTVKKIFRFRKAAYISD